MREQLSALRILDLPSGGLVPFTSRPGERVCILQGRVWLTEEGNVNDAFLASGEEVRLASRGLAVIEALGPARVQVFDAVARPSPVARAAGALAGRAASAWRRWAWRVPRVLRGSV